MELAHFYGGWTIEQIRSMTLGELDVARKYMIEYRKNEQKQGGGQQRNGS